MIMGSRDLNHIEAVEFFPFKAYQAIENVQLFIHNAKESRESAKQEQEEIIIALNKSY